MKAASLTQTLEDAVRTGLKDLYGADASQQTITLQATRREFEGEYTVVTFPLTRLAKKKPDVIAEELGQHLKERVAEVADYNVIKGFLNLVIADRYWKEFLLGRAAGPILRPAPGQG